MCEDRQMSEAERLIRRFTLAPEYIGFRPLVLAVEMVLEDESYLLMLYKRLYPDLAQRVGSTPAAIERSLRALVTLLWQSGHQELFTEIAGRTLTKKPSSTDFIDLAVAYIRRGQAG